MPYEHLWGTSHMRRVAHIDSWTGTTKPATTGPRPLGEALVAIKHHPEPSSPKPKRPRVEGGSLCRRYVLRRKLPPLVCWLRRYAKLPARVWQDERLHRGAIVSLAVILSAARGRQAFTSCTRSLAADAGIHERTMYNHLLLLVAAGYIATHRAKKRGRVLLVMILDPALARHQPLPDWAEAGWALHRSPNPKARDELAGVNRRLRRAYQTFGLSGVGIAFPTPIVLTHSESRTGDGKGFQRV